MRGKISCYSLDGFMIDIELNRKAERKAFVNGIKLACSQPERIDGSTINVCVTTKVSYIGSTNGGACIGKEQVPADWERLISVTAPQYNLKKEDGIIEIDLQHSIPLDIGDRRGFYFVASEDIIKFGEGVYYIINDDDIELHSSLAVSGLFGVGIDGFGLNFGVSYTLDDSLPLTVIPTSSPSSPLPTTPPPSMKVVADLDNTLKEMYYSIKETEGAGPTFADNVFEDIHYPIEETKKSSSSRSKPQPGNNTKYIITLAISIYIGFIFS